MLDDRNEKKKFFIGILLACLGLFTNEGSKTKAFITALKVDFPAALSSQEEEWLQNCQFIQSADHPLEFTCLWQQEYVDLLHGKWRQWSVRFDASGHIQPTQPMIYPSLDQNIKRGNCSRFPGAKFFSLLPGSFV